MKAHQRKNPSRSLRRLNRRVAAVKELIHSTSSDVETMIRKAHDADRSEEDREYWQEMAANRRRSLPNREAQLARLEESLKHRIA
jgi:glutathione S-transferase